MVNLAITFANSLADRRSAWVVGASLDAAVLLALVSLVWLAIRNRVAPQVGYFLFLLVPLKLLVPVVVTVPAAVAHWTPHSLISSCLSGEEPPQIHESRTSAETRLGIAATAHVGRSESRPTSSGRWDAAGSDASRASLAENHHLRRPAASARVGLTGPPPTPIVFPLRLGS
jgi:hypothetical protein